MPARTANATSSQSAKNWWNEPWALFQTNLQEVDATMDVDKVLDFIQGHGCDTWLLNTGGIASFYPTDLPFQTRSPFLVNRPSGDMIGDAVAAAGKRGVRVISRCDFSKVSARIAAEHPEWLFLSPKGERQIYNTLYSTCPNGAYYQERSLDIIDDIISRYPVDGFFFNWFSFSEADYSRVYHGPCHCENCRRDFAAFSGGKPLPDDPQSPTYSLWMRYTDSILRRLTDKITKHIVTHYPGTALMLGRGAQIIMHEANNAFGRELWPHQTSENVSAFNRGHPEAALLVNSVSFVDMPYRMAGEQPEHFAQYLLQAIAQGGRPSTYIMGAPGRIPYPNLPLAGEITRFFRDNREMYGALAPNATIALARPDRLRSAEPGYGQSVSEFRGIYRSLMEKHLPFDTIGAEVIAKMSAEGNLAQYRLIILPNLGALGAKAAAALDAFVAAGGNLMLTGDSAIAEGGGMEIASSPATMRSGMPVSGQQLWSTYMTDNSQPGMADYRYQALTLPIYGAYARFVWKPGVEKRGMVLPSAPFGPPEKCYGHAGSDDPGAVRMKRNGTVVQMPWTVGHTYYEFGTTDVRDYLIAQIADLVDTRVTGELPDQVEMIIGRSGDDTVIHLINQTGWRRKSFGPHLPVNGGRLRIHGGKNPRLLVSKEFSRFTAGRR